MSDGGTFTNTNSPNVQRPGAYVNFVSVSRPFVFAGGRGVSCGLVELPWYLPNQIVKVSGMDFLSGRALRDIGLTAFDGEAAKHVSLLLSGCFETRLVSANVGGEKAMVSIPITGGTLEIEAAKFGTFGNDLLVSCQEVSNGRWLFSAHIIGHESDHKPRMNQTVESVRELRGNDFITINVIPDDPNVEPAFIEFAGEVLTGGSNGNVNLATRIPAFLRKIKSDTSWQCMGWQWSEESHKLLVQQFIQRMRDSGRYVQVSMAAAQANHEGINNVHIGHGNAINPITGEIFTIDEIALMHASMTAGADIVTSNTNTPLLVQLEFDHEFDNAEITEGLQQGRVMFTRRNSGIIKIEQDINSLHTFTPEKNREFRKNNILRKLDEIGFFTESIWENFYMGNAINDEIDREAYRVQINEKLERMQRMRALQNHHISRISIMQGDEPDIVEATLDIHPTDAMERIFKIVRVHTQAPAV
ncbi:MAG: hypothetical protein FWD01_01760 [Defluviitaleaceae bacterium]|nr:hypothetical protein [Defluviitaleaceae bacterium]